MRHCDVNFEEQDTWFLEDIKEFKQRVLIIGKCPVCKKKVVVLRETRISDNIVFENIETEDKAEKIAKREKKRIVYTSRQRNNCFGGWVYGVNTEIKHRAGDKKGQTSQIRQYSYDYSTNKSRGKIKQTRV